MTKRKRDLVSLLDFLHLSYEEVSNNQEILTDCFVCGKEKHLYINKENQVYFCHVCGAGGHNNQLEQLVLEYVVAQAEKDPRGMEYFTQRGLSEDVIRLGRLGYYARNECYTIPYISARGTTERLRGENNGAGISTRTITNIAFRSADDAREPKYFRLPGYATSPYVPATYAREFPGGPVVVITEGEIDALSINCCADPRLMGIATGGANNTGSRGTAVLLAEIPRDARLVACFDNDPAGLRGLKGLRRALPSVHLAKLPSGVHDANDCLSKLGASVLQQAILDALNTSPAEPPAVDAESNDSNVSHHEQRSIPSTVYITLPDDTGDWLVEDIWMDRSLGFVAGIPKALKSMLALHMGYHISMGKPFVGKQIRRPGPVILFQEEDNDHVIKSRLRSINAGVGSPDLHLFTPGVTGVHMRLDSDASLQLLDEEILRIQPVLVILDPLANMHSLEDENQASSVNRLLESVRHLRDLRKCSFMIVHHLRKAGEGDSSPGQRMRGSSVFHAKSECALYLSRFGNLVRISIENKIAPGRVLEIEYSGTEFKYVDEYGAGTGDAS